MITGEYLNGMATIRLSEGELLYKNGFHQGAYYIAGYAVEFALKALICKRLGVEPFAIKVKGEPQNDNNAVVSNALKIHDLSALLIFSGLYPIYKEMKDKSDGSGRQLFTAWSSVSDWSEQRRYSPLTCEETTVAKFLRSVKLIMEWIQSHY